MSFTNATGFKIGLGIAAVGIATLFGLVAWIVQEEKRSDLESAQNEALQLAGEKPEEQLVCRTLFDPGTMGNLMMGRDYGEGFFLAARHPGHPNRHFVLMRTVDGDYRIADFETLDDVRSNTGREFEGAVLDTVQDIYQRLAEQAGRSLYEEESADAESADAVSAEEDYDCQQLLNGTVTSPAFQTAQRAPG